MTKYELLAATALAMAFTVPTYAQTVAPAPQEGPAGIQASPSAATPATTDQTNRDVDVSEDDGTVVVTAAKREQTLQDVPISVSVTSNDTIEKAQILDLKDLQTVVPSLKVTQFQSAGQTNFTIRGFGNGNGNIGIESSVGVFVDGVYRSRSASAIADLPELERIEVLRGPQSTLFGKNVSAGAISIVTKRPQFDWGLRAEATAGNYGAIQGNAAITGPITKEIAFRVYGSFNKRDGYFTNIIDGSDVNDKNRYSLRGDLLFEPSSDLSVRIIGDYNHINEVCCGAATIQNGPATQLIGAPTAILGLGSTIGDPARIFKRELIYNTAPNNRLTGKGISGQIDYNAGFAKLTSITAYRKQTNDATLDVDFTSADISNQITNDSIKTFTQEFRLTSTGDGPFNWLLGAFYSDEKIDTARDIRFGRQGRAFINAVTVSRNAAGIPTGAPPVTTLETLLRAAGNTAITPGAYFFTPGQGISDAYRLKDRSYSIFGQADYKLTERLTVTAGGAYLNDRKKARSNVVLNDLFSLLDLNNVAPLGLLPLAIIAPGAPAGARIPVNLFAGLNAVQFFYANTTNHAPVNFPNANESGILKGNKFTYTGRVAYDLADALNLYASYGTGWKAGAYNLSSDSRPPDPNGIGRTADPENVRVAEIGAKAKFSGGYFNLALFDQSIKGFQSNAFTGTGFALVNAGKQSVKGFEVDTAYRPFRGLQLTGAVTYLDAKYDSFTRATCPSFAPECQVPAGSPAGTLAPQFRDLSGQRPAGIPKWATSVSGTYTANLWGDWTGFVRGEYDYASRTQLTDTVPAAINTYDMNVVNASIGLNSGDGLGIQFFVRNLTKDNFLLSAFQTVIQSGSYSGYANEPRTYGVTLRKQF